MRNVVCLLVLTVLNAFSVASTIDESYDSYEFNDPSVDLSSYSSQLSVVSFEDGIILEDSNLKKVYQVTTIDDNYNEVGGDRITASFQESGIDSMLAFGNFYGEYTLSSNLKDVSAIIYIVAFDDESVEIEFSADDSGNVNASGISLTVPDIAGFIKFGSDTERCNYSFEEEGEYSFSISTCEAEIEVTDDNGITYAYTADFDGATAEFNDFDYESTEEMFTTVYLKGLLYDASSQHKGYVRVYMNGNFLITDLDNNVL